MYVNREEKRFVVATRVKAVMFCMEKRKIAALVMNIHFWRADNTKDEKIAFCSRLSSLDYSVLSCSQERGALVATDSADNESVKVDEWQPCVVWFPLWPIFLLDAASLVLLYWFDNIKDEYSRLFWIGSASLIAVPGSFGAYVYGFHKLRMKLCVTYMWHFKRYILSLPCLVDVYCT